MNKKSLLKVMISLLSILGMGLSFTSAVTLRLNLNGLDGIALSEADFQRNVLPVHFADNGNNFGGFLYFSNSSGDSTDGLGDFSVQIGNDTSSQQIYQCKKQVKGFYYNAERGERLWPLDGGTFLSLNGGLEVEGGLYTRCLKLGYEQALQDCVNNISEEYNECVNRVNSEFGADEFGYYGEIRQVYSGETFVLVSGVEYTGGNTFVSIKPDSGFAPTFIRYGNKYPIGLIYDYNGGVGFVGGQIQNPEDDSIRQIIEDLDAFSGAQNIANLLEEDEDGVKFIGSGVNIDIYDLVRDPILGLVIEGIIGMGNSAEFEVIGNQVNNKMQYLSSATVNQQTLINHMRKSAEILCRGKWRFALGSNITSDVVCVNAKGTTVERTSALKNKTLIVKNGNVKIYPMDASSDFYYDIFIDNGDLIIDETNAPMFVFGTNGFRSSTNPETFSGMVSGANGYYSGDDAAIGSFIQGNFIINGFILGQGNNGLQHKYFLYGKLYTKDDFNALMETFKWRCNNGYATDGTVCPGSLRGWTNPYEKASLVIIDQDYKSKLFNI